MQTASHVHVKLVSVDQREPECERDPGWNRRWRWFGKEGAALSSFSSQIATDRSKCLSLWKYQPPPIVYGGSRVASLLSSASSRMSATTMDDRYGRKRESCRGGQVLGTRRDILRSSLKISIRTQRVTVDTLVMAAAPGEFFNQRQT